MSLPPDVVAKYYRPVAAPARKARTMIERADEVPIQEILNDEFGIVIPGEVVDSWKHRCPFGFEHEDGGLDPNCRTYSTNSTHCFAMHGTMRPTQLYARKHNLQRHRAAAIILDVRGLLQPLNYRDRWASRGEGQTSLREPLGAPHDMVAALQRALDADADYSRNELADGVQAEWHEALESLNQVMNSGTADIAELREWLDRSTARILAAAR